MSDEKIYPPLVIEVVGTTATNWILEGTEKDPKRMAWSGQMRVIPTSKVREDTPDGRFRYKPIRHIAGCDIIDPVEQAKQGFTPNLELDNIWIAGGSATFLREGSTIGTYDFLKNYEGNTSNPLRPPDAEDVFREVVAVEVAKSQNVSFDKKADAYAILREIRTPVPEDDSYVYDEEKLALISTLFDLNHLDTAEEKFLELYRIADTRPDLIVGSVANGKKKLFALIKKADDLSVITFSEENVRFTEGKTVLLGWKGKVAKNTQINKLADYLMTADGKVFMQQLTLAVEKAGSKTLERVKVPEESIS